MVLVVVVMEGFSPDLEALVFEVDVVAENSVTAMS